MKISTHSHSPKDWYATFTDYYDGTHDSTGLSAMYGTGDTEQEAIDSLKEQHRDYCEDQPCIDCLSNGIDAEMNRADDEQFKEAA